jgi:proteasome accessory factor B
MKTATRPQYHRLQRVLEMIREGTRTGCFPNCGDFASELGVSRRTLMRDLDFLCDDHHAPIAYDESRKGFRLTDSTFKLVPVELTQREVFTFSIARKLLERFEGTPLEMDMRSVLAKIGESLQGTVSLDVESLTEQFTVLSEDHARVDPEIWQRAARAINQRERLTARYQRFDGETRDYALEPCHLAAYHGNWYLVALNTAAGRLETFALSRLRHLWGWIGLRGIVLRKQGDRAVEAAARLRSFLTSFSDAAGGDRGGRVRRGCGRGRWPYRGWF